MKCRVCGAENLYDAKYCINCGSLLENNEIQKGNNFDGSNININKSPLGVSSMVLGIISTIMGVICCFGWVNVVISILFGVLAIVFSIKAWNSGSRGQVVAGLVLGIIGLTLGIILLVLNSIDPELFIQWFEDNYPDLWDEYNNI